MKIKISEIFYRKFIRQIDYISVDKPKAARKFRDDVLAKIKEIPSMPYKNRRSSFYEDDNIRDLIFKGYIVIYRINENEIDVFGFVKYTENP